MKLTKSVQSGRVISIHATTMAQNTSSSPPAPVEPTSLRQEIHQVIASVHALINASARPLPTQTGDGSYVIPPVTTGLIQDLRKMDISDVESVLNLVTTSVTGKATNDKTYFMEKLIKLASELPVSSKNGLALTNGLVNRLWSDLQHPPLSYLDSQHMYRQADGSCNVFALWTSPTEPLLNYT